MPFSLFQLVASFFCLYKIDAYEKLVHDSVDWGSQITQREQTEQ